MPITTGSLPKLLQEGLNELYGQNMPMVEEMQYAKLFDVERENRKNYIEDQALTPLGSLVEMPELGDVQFDTIGQSYLKRYRFTKYALAMDVSAEALSDGLYWSKIQVGGPAFARASMTTKETVAHAVFNNGFDSTYTGSDGKELFATDHPHKSGGTWKNELTVASNISEAALEQAYVDKSNWVDDKGHHVRAQIKSLHVPVEQAFNATRILKNINRPGTAERDINALVKMNVIPEVYIHNYFTSTTAWFLKTDVKPGCKFIIRWDDKITQDVAFTSDTLRYKIVTRFGVGWTDPHSAFGSAGAG